MSLSDRTRVDSPTHQFEDHSRMNLGQQEFVELLFELDLGCPLHTWSYGQSWIHFAIGSLSIVHNLAGDRCSRAAAQTRTGVDSAGTRPAKVLALHHRRTWPTRLRISKTEDLVGDL